MTSSLVDHLHNCASAEETEALGFRLAEQVVVRGVLPCIILLSGNIGAGKTVFGRGVARGLGIEEPVQSPTFPILLEYPGVRVPLYHFDLYRLGGSEEFDLIGGEDILFSGGSYGPGLSLIEWPERLDRGGRTAVVPCFLVELRFPWESGRELGKEGAEIQEQAPDYQRRFINVRSVSL
ncbi:tRNA (adenosine(37)-N6)-threonylcarbamoyltransferase complex ATPase subunit type 1 TsaE [Candidatus Haliotispira prima]|uniref:tRNA threonylcarbamoyladenosine biosynthesis protein TsaE n=1 Tax=Candidatus Haliotispira prima TaxID=3034016 RepID=A0ABY8MGJ0_9SPIO|nr:tRNA (adenosine(37)-N6)-threonylcarbamoyltransferase complex ATPase subunit type 1 TsaE [Candidatus Haliotispira prima]